MKPHKIVQFMKAVGVMNASDHKRGGNVVGRCPLGPWSHKAGISSEFTFGTKIEHGDPPCNCFACGYKGTLGTLLQRVIGENKLNPSGLDYDFKTAMDLLVEAEEDDPEIDFDAIPDIEENLAANKNAMHLFPEAWLSTFPLAIHVPLGRAYLKKRGVGLICLAVGFLSAFLVYAEHPGRHEAEIDAVQALLYVGLLICALGYYLRTRRGENRRLSDWLETEIQP